MMGVDPMPIRTLIADDQPDVVEALRLLLKGEGIQTEAVSSPAAAVEAIESGEFDLLLMDLNYARDTTSGREGLDLLSRVRALDNVLPIVVMTAWGSMEVALEALHRGVTDFVLKPWENVQLVSMLRRHIEAGRAARGSSRLVSERQRELEDAKEIQQRLIPRSIPRIEGYSVAAAWEPARTVSGDYYDVLSYSPQKTALCIGDVSGKGMPAALLMSNVQAAVRAYGSVEVSPADLCAKLNRTVSSNTDSDRFISFFCGVLDAQAGMLNYSNAGHNSPILMRADGSVLRLERGGVVLGPLPEAEYENGEISINAGDRLILFTDGVTEAQDDHGEEFGEQRLIELLFRYRELNAVSLKDRITDALAAFGSGRLHDDLTLLVLSAD